MKIDGRRSLCEIPIKSGAGNQKTCPTKYTWKISEERGDSRFKRRGSQDIEFNKIQNKIQMGS